MTAMTVAPKSDGRHEWPMTIMTAAIRPGSRQTLSITAMTVANHTMRAAQQRHVAGTSIVQLCCVNYI